MYCFQFFMNGYIYVIQASLGTIVFIMQGGASQIIHWSTKICCFWDAISGMISSNIYDILSGYFNSNCNFIFFSSIQLPLLPEGHFPQEYTHITSLTTTINLRVPFWDLMFKHNFSILSIIWSLFTNPPGLLNGLSLFYEDLYLCNRGSIFYLVIAFCLVFLKFLIHNFCFFLWCFTLFL